MISWGAPHSHLRRRIALKGSNPGTWKMDFHLLKSFIPIYALEKMYVIPLLLMLIKVQKDLG